MYNVHAAWHQLWIMVPSKQSIFSLVIYDLCIEYNVQLVVFVAPCISTSAFVSVVYDTVEVNKFLSKMRGQPNWNTIHSYSIKIEFLSGFFWSRTKFHSVVVRFVVVVFYCSLGTNSVIICSIIKRYALRAYMYSAAERELNRNEKQQKHHFGWSLSGPVLLVLLR